MQKESCTLKSKRAGLAKNQARRRTGQKPQAQSRQAWQQKKFSALGSLGWARLRLRLGLRLRLRLLLSFFQHSAGLTAFGPVQLLPFFHEVCLVPQIVERYLGPPGVQQTGVDVLLIPTLVQPESAWARQSSLARVQDPLSTAT